MASESTAEGPGLVVLGIGLHGYSSASHFIKEFRSRFGTTPRAYVDAQALGDQMAALRQA